VDWNLFSIMRRGGGGGGGGWGGGGGFRWLSILEDGMRNARYIEFRGSFGVI
jgi:hypothetical protein